MKILLFSAHCVLLLFLNSNALAESSVFRSLYVQKNTLFVEDRLNISSEFAGREPETWRLFQQVQLGTNILEAIQVLLNGESLKVLDFDYSCKSNMIFVHIISSVVISSNSVPAKLRWVSSWGGDVSEFGDAKVSLGKRQEEMSILLMDGNYILWFPDLGPATDYLEQFSVFKQSYDTSFSTDKLECTLGTGSKSIKLLSRFSGNVPPISDVVRLNKLNKKHGISCNDLMSMCTSTKIAKAGYYNIVEFCQGIN
jgi:hypothetical protein